MKCITCGFIVLFKLEAYSRHACEGKDNHKRAQHLSLAEEWTENTVCCRPFILHHVLCL